MKRFGRAAGVHDFATDSAQYSALAQHDAGFHVIPVEAIVGSVGRSHELNSDFRPFRKSRDAWRYCAVLEAMERRSGLPAIDVYKLGNRYYVVDGHHRVAAAHKTGQKEMDAFVIEFQPVPSVSNAAA